jgi:hypothetical protein
MGIESGMLTGKVQDILNEHAKKKKAWLEKIEQLPFEQSTFSKDELITVRALTRVLNDYLDKFEKQKSMNDKISQSFSSFPKGKEHEFKVLTAMMNMLDKCDHVWSSKFSTESQGTGKDLVETPNDSVYYMTKSGASIRFKMANLEKGIRRVIQPFAEFIYFHNPELGNSEAPKIGYFTQEYFTQEFEDMCTRKEEIDGDYQSSIKKYYQDGRFVAAPKTDKVTFQHNGSPVNKVYFEK